MVPAHVDAGEIRDYGVGTAEIRVWMRRTQRDHASARSTGCRDTGGRVLEYDTCRGVVTEAFRAKLITFRGRLSLQYVFPGHDDSGYRQSDRRQAQLRECSPTRRDDRPAALREGRQELADPRYGDEAIDISELRGVEPGYLPFDVEMRSHGLHGVARPAPMRDPEQRFGIEVMALSPLATDALDDGAGVDEDAVQVKQKRRGTEVHST